MIQLIRLGISGEELVDKINEIISAINGMEHVTDYNQLINKPTINGVTLDGDVGLQRLNIRMEDMADYNSTIGSLATKAELSTTVNGAIATAQATAENLVAGKMDADLGNIEEVTMIGKEAYTLISGDGGVRKIKVSGLSDNVALTLQAKDSYDAAVEKGKRIIELSGDQNGNNVDYTCKEGFVLGTTALYLNGQMLIRNTDYIESSSYSITMLTQVPVSTDRMVFVAVPISSL